MSNTFRANTLTVIGAIGYLVAFAIVIIETLAGDPIPVRAVALVLLASAAALGVDFALDFAPIQISTRPDSPEDERQKGEGG